MGTKLDFFPSLTLALIPLPLAPHQWPMGFILPKLVKDFGHVVGCRKEAEVKDKHYRRGAPSPDHIPTPCLGDLGQNLQWYRVPGGCHI